MKVFISWSGERSKNVAEAIRAWLPKVLQSVRPWMSQEDITAGARWLTEVSSELSNAKVGIICVTPENQLNPWLQFESGALSKTIEQTYVCPVLLNMEPGQIVGPLTQFQSIVLDQDGVMRLLNTLNNALAEQHMPQGQLEEIFEVWWPKLKDKLLTIPAATETIVRRTNDEMLEEVLQNTREQIRRENIRLEYSKERDSKFDSLLGLMESSFGFMKQSRDMSLMLQKMCESMPPHQGKDILIDLPEEKDGKLFMDVLSKMKDAVAGPGSDINFNVDTLNEMLSNMKSLDHLSKKTTENILKGPKVVDSEVMQPTLKKGKKEKTTANK